MRSLKNLGGRVVPGGFRFPEPDQDRTYSTLRELVNAVLEYRRANAIEVESREALQAEIEDWICENIGSAEYYCLEDGRPMAPRDHTGAPRTTGYKGAEKWGQLHRWALLGEGNDIPRRLWLERFGFSLPCGECRREWRKLLAQNPAPLEASPFELFIWTVDRHDDVRRRLGQEPFGIAAALALYGANPPAPEPQ